MKPLCHRAVMYRFFDACKVEDRVEVYLCTLNRGHKNTHHHHESGATWTEDEAAYSLNAVDFYQCPYCMYLYQDGETIGCGCAEVVGGKPSRGKAKTDAARKVFG